MSDVVQFRSISPAARRAIAKRLGAAVVASDAADTITAGPAQAANLRPVEPVALVEPCTRLTITRDESANAFVYRSIDEKSREVVWQYPVEHVLRMAYRLRELEGYDAHKIDARV